MKFLSTMLGAALVCIGFALPFSVDMQPPQVRTVAAQPAVPMPPDAKKADAPKAEEAPKSDHATKPKGLKKPADIEERHVASWKRSGHNMKALPQVTATSFDCRTAGWVPDFDNQMQCGDCWVFSGADCCASAFRKAGYGKINFSKQQLIDCQIQGACDGGFPEDVAKLAKSVGLVTDDDYGKAYTGSPGQCKQIDPSKFMKIADYGFVSQGSGIASYQDFKNAMLKFGVISLCLDATGIPSTGSSGPVWKGNGGRSVDHAIKAIAFDDSKSPKGAVLCWNQWYNDDRDYFWAEWGANQIGDSALWTTAVALPPPPIPPTPTPPVPPVPPSPCPQPGPAPVVTTLTIDPINKTVSFPSDGSWTALDGLVIDTKGLTAAELAAIKAQVAAVQDFVKAVKENGRRREKLQQLERELMPVGPASKY